MEDRERIATLEAQYRDLSRRLAEIHNDTREIRTTLTAYKGLVGGVVLTVSIVWSSGLAVWHLVKHKFG